MARAGWAVTVHEAEATIGGGVRSAELTMPGYVHDVCSAIHPLGRDSPFFRDLELPVEWVQPPAPAAHPLDDGSAVMLERSFLGTAEALGEDRAAYMRAFSRPVMSWPQIEPIVLGPHPPAPRRVLSAFSLALTRTGLSNARDLAGRDRKSTRLNSSHVAISY